MPKTLFGVLSCKPFQQANSSIQHTSSRIHQHPTPNATLSPLHQLQKGFPTCLRAHFGFDQLTSLSHLNLLFSRSNPLIPKVKNSRMLNRVATIDLHLRGKYSA